MQVWSKTHIASRDMVRTNSQTACDLENGTEDLNPYHILSMSPKYACVSLVKILQFFRSNGAVKLFHYILGPRVTLKIGKIPSHVPARYL